MHYALAVRMAASDPLVEVLVGTVGLIVIVFVHGAGIRSISRHFSQRWVLVTSATPRWRVNLLLAGTIGALCVVHFIETLLWAIPISATGMIPEMRNSYYFVLENYTTLGTGDVTLPAQWRLIGPIIAMSGLFTFSWTAGVLVNVMNEFGKLDRTRARDENAHSGDQSDPPF